jgi:hypothetical protein
MDKISIAILILLILGVTAVPQRQQSHFVTTGVGISVHLGQPPGPFAVGEPIHVRVDLSNDSKQTLMVCRDLDIGSESCFWEFETRDASDHSLPTGKLAADRIPAAPAPFPNALISNWTALAPKYKYGTMLSLELALPWKPQPGHHTVWKLQPGRYRVRAILTSDGPSGESVYNDLPHYPNELASLPYPGWKGKAVSNWVSITIIEAK